ncbi:hypothetical protein AGOR_G00066130 [Albula goreensis]|uniref:Inosine/uridine-preferring nucleoside hydrolase domain-containing protein n=1 Tax=Albula goreensis TaxID=1534307 RepID=A0A8T3DRZ1_9TELE|nr:hypothetical protein AGOR_G00066130 [Albula goreensis]
MALRHSTRLWSSVHCSFAQNTGRFTALWNSSLTARSRYPGRCTDLPSCRILSYSTPGSTMVKKLIVDVDCGVDDAQAIMIALAAPDVKVLGITCVHGNTTVENVCKNALRVLKACQRLEIPVFCGASKPILGKTLSAGHFHGQDGLGDSPDPDAPGLEMVQKEGAVAAMIRIANEHPGEVSLVATAPLTALCEDRPHLPTENQGPVHHGREH